MPHRISIFSTLYILIILSACSSPQVLTEAQRMPTLRGKTAEVGFQEYYNLKSVYLAKNVADAASAHVEFIVGGDGSVREIAFTGLKTADAYFVQFDIAKYLKIAPWLTGRNDKKPVDVKLSVAVYYNRSKVIGDMQKIKNEKTDIDQVWSFCEDMPKFDGKPALDSFDKYLKDNINTLVAAGKSAYLSFLVYEDGSLSNPEVYHYDDPVIKKEILRVIETSPPLWIPGFVREKPVRVKLNFLVKFE